MSRKKTQMVKFCIQIFLLVIQFVKWVYAQITYRSRLEAKIDDIMRRTLRTEIEMNMQRGDVKAVHEVGDTYLKAGYNSYMRERLLKYYKEHPIKE